MNGYVCFYQQQRIEIQAESSYKAQLEAAKVFKVKGIRITAIAVVLAEKNGVPVVQSTAGV